MLKYIWHFQCPVNTRNRVKMACICLISANKKIGIKYTIMLMRQIKFYQANMIINSSGISLVANHALSKSDNTWFRLLYEMFEFRRYLLSWCPDDKYVKNIQILQSTLWCSVAIMQIQTNPRACFFCWQQRSLRAEIIVIALICKMSTI